MKFKENLQLLNPIYFSQIPHEHFVFYDKDIEDIENLLLGSLENTSYIPIQRSDDFFEKIYTHLTGKNNIDVSVVAHGNNEGFFIGRNFIDKDYLTYNSSYLRCLNIDKFSIFSCNTGQNINLINKFAQVLDCDVFGSSNLIGHSLKNANWNLDVCSNFNKSASNKIVPFKIVPQTSK